MTALLILYLASGGLLVSISLPLLFEKIPPNSLYGFRLPQTLDNPKVWYVTNRFAAKRLIWAGVSVTIAALLLYFIPGITIDSYVLGCLAVFVAVFTVGLLQSIRYLRAVVQKENSSH